MCWRMTTATPWCRNCWHATWRSRTAATFSVALLNGGLFPETHRARPLQKLMAGPLGPLLALLTTRTQLLATFSAVFGTTTQPDAATLEAVWQLVNENKGLRTLPPLLAYIAERREHRTRWVDALQRAPHAATPGPEKKSGEAYA